MPTAPNTLLPSQASYLSYGVTRQNLQYILSHHWTIGLNYRDCISTYFIRKWNTDYVFQIAIQDGIIWKEGIAFLVVYRHPIYTVKANQQCILSFRRAQPEFNLPAYVIIDSVLEDEMK